MKSRAILYTMSSGTQVNTDDDGDEILEGNIWNKRNECFTDVQTIDRNLFQLDKTNWGNL